MIGEDAFKKFETENELLIPNGVEEIGDSAFRGAKIPSLIIPKNLLMFGDSAFVEF